MNKMKMLNKRNLAIVAIFQAERGLIFWPFYVTLLNLKEESKLDDRLVFIGCKLGD